MDKTKVNIERLLIVGLAIILMTFMIGGGTLARVTKRGEVTNEITSGEIAVKLLNQNGNGEEMPELITCIKPGSTLDNNVRVMNTCKQNEYIRISLSKIIYESKDSDVILDDSKANFLFNEKDWTYSDGYYYYNKELASNEITEPLYDGIKLDESMGNEYKTAVMDVEIVVEAVQSVNNGDIFTAQGWEQADSFGKADIPEYITDMESQEEEPLTDETERGDA